MTTHQAARRAAQAIYDANESNPSITLTAQGMATVIEQEYAPIVEAARGLRDAANSALAATWDGHYGNGVVVEYAQAVDREVKAALAAAKEAGI